MTDRERLRDFARKYQDMRAIQARYFQSRTPQNLAIARDAERRLDKLADELLNPPSPGLFDNEVA